MIDLAQSLSNRDDLITVFLQCSLESISQQRPDFIELEQIYNSMIKKEKETDKSPTKRSIKKYDIECENNKSSMNDNCQQNETFRNNNSIRDKSCNQDETGSNSQNMQDKSSSRMR